MKKRFLPKSMTAVTLLLILAILGTWLVSMCCLTLITAQELYDRLYDASRAFPKTVEQFSRLHEYYDKSYSNYGRQQEHSEYIEHNILFAIAANTETRLYSDGNYADYRSDRSKLIRSIPYPMETAVLFYDGDGRLLHSSGRSTLYFEYCTQEEWDAGLDSASAQHYGWIDMSEGKDTEDYKEDPYLRFRTMYAGTRSMFDIPAIRVQGYLDGTHLIPAVMHFITEGQVHQIVESDPQFSTGPDSYAWILSDVDRTGKLEWQLQFDRSEEYDGMQLETFYLLRPEMWEYPSASLEYDGIEYESLPALTESIDFPSWTGISPYDAGISDKDIYRLNELLIFSGQTYADYEGLDSTAQEDPEEEYILVTAVRTNPLACAIRALRNLYILTGLLAVILLLTVRSRMKHHLIQPVMQIADSMENGWKSIYRSDSAPAMWKDADRLYAEFMAERDWRRMKDNEVHRLNTALEYAKTAEINRRQMTSAIAHELKTPLAVIHSYAEGLKEHIAEEKRDKYVDVIISEVERTDSMVLEMLDLSRLEAGKVKLSRDDFSLIALTRSIFEKLSMAAQAKDLQIEFSFPDEFTMTADEGRIAQVVENFATNAIKYTPAGGHILVKIQCSSSSTRFSIENDSQPLSSAALSKVWDTFYRTDEARSGGGTGLGLAIAKNIVELHGGTCAVRNTRTGVEFSFTI